MRASQRLQHCASELADIAANPPREVNGHELARLSARILSVAAHVAMGERTSTPETRSEPTAEGALKELRGRLGLETAVATEASDSPWERREDPYLYCRSCGNIQQRGHVPNCPELNRGKAL